MNKSLNLTNDSIGRPRFKLGETGEGFDSALTERVRLYLKVTFLINAFLTTVVIILTLSVDNPAEGDQYEDVFWSLLVTATNGMAWFLISKSRRTARGTTLTASLVTLILSASYTYVCTNNPSDPNPSRSLLFALMAVTVVLVLRSSLIPSPAGVTALIGALSVSFPIYMSRPAAAHSGWTFLSWMVSMGLVFVAVTTVTSHTIYGMQRRVDAAAQLGQYHIERLLGRGGMGEVYLATHALLQRPTAVKLLRDVSGGAMRDRFRQEVQTASGLSHPNTVEIYDYGRTPEGIFYFAMEYVEGATLEDVVHATGAMSAPRVMHLIWQASCALAEAHARGLVHRDIKPSNLMLCERGGQFDTLKVMDFGLVRDLTETSPSEEQGLTGTPLYLAPETILEAEGTVPQSDVYALGATAYFLLTGRPPFFDGGLVEILSDHLATVPTPPASDDPTFAALVLRCLTKSPHDRPPDAKELVAELETCRDFGQWKQRDAEIWWAEHQEVVATRPTSHGTSGMSRERSQFSLLG